MKRALRFVVVVTLVLLPALALAQPKKRALRDELPPPAQALYDDALRSMQQTPPEYDRASAKFQEAYDASHNPRLLQNIAVCERNLQHYARAAAKFKQELAEGAGKLSAQEKADIQSSIAALERYISTIELTVSEPDAAVFIDNLKVGTTPLGPIPTDISSAPHQLRVEKEGFLPYEKPDVLVGSTAPVKLTVELEPRVKKSQVEISVSGAPGASIFVDGIDRGPAPFKGLLEIGPHKFEARQAGYEPAAQQQEVVFKQPLRLQLSLEREVREGTVRIESLSGAQLEIDGKVVGTTLWEGKLQTGTHTVGARKDGYNPGTMEIYVGKGETVSRRLPLTAEKKNDWVFWTVGTVLVIAGATTAAALIFSPKDQSPVIGTLDPGLVRASHGVRF